MSDDKIGGHVMIIGGDSSVAATVIRALLEETDRYIVSMVPAFGENTSHRIAEHYRAMEELINPPKPMLVHPRKQLAEQILAAQIAPLRSHWWEFSPKIMKVNKVDIARVNDPNWEYWHPKQPLSQRRSAWSNRRG